MKIIILLYKVPPVSNLHKKWRNNWQMFLKIRVGSYCLAGVKVSLWGDKKATEMEGGISCTVVWVNQMLWSSILKNGWNAPGMRNPLLSSCWWWWWWLGMQMTPKMIKVIAAVLGCFSELKILLKKTTHFGHRAWRNPASSDPEAYLLG